ncbi:D-alanine--D-alanine ligase family protein [Rhodothermus marinus]|uniref:D-alanine--D-alanine ligase family protein n=1 Tax=Rhodothermus marinus TaxID=29549 RepID=UPI0037C83F77
MRVGVVFGGVSPEHEVSVITGLQAAAALDRTRYEIVPLYIAKDGSWYTGPVLLELEAYQDLDALRRAAIPVRFDPAVHGRMLLVEAMPRRWLWRRPRRYLVDVVLLALHGGEGENGGVQGLCETLNVPYTGSGVLGSALGMDKVLSKLLCREQGIPVVDFRWFREADWAGREEEWLDRLEAELGYPMVVKPARLGSSIGIQRVEDRQALDAAIEEAFRYDEKVVVERAVRNLREINCAVLGDPSEARPSVLEEPVRSDPSKLLTFQDKYMRGGGKAGRRAGKQQAPQGMASLDRIIPAPLDEAQTRAVQEMAVRVFQLFECAGVARIDFLLDDDTGQVYFNEINTIPGSFSFYLWEPVGVPFDALMDELIRLAQKRHREKNGRVRSYDVNLLSVRSLQGLKGAKQRS